MDRNVSSSSTSLTSASVAAEQKHGQEVQPVMYTREYRVKEEFCSKTLKQAANTNLDPRQCYGKFDFRNLGLGYLYHNKTHENYKKEGKGFPWLLQEKFKRPPLVILSSGRPDSALLDYSSVLSEPYAQIVVVTRRECDAYMRRTCNYPQIDLFVLESNTKRTIGAARYATKKLMEIILRKSENPFFMMLDDN